MCGVFGVYSHPEAARVTYLGLYALQHRGEESAGIVSYDGKTPKVHKGMGLVGDIFSEEKIRELKGDLAIGHNRYSTTGSSLLRNVQPFLVNYKKVPIAIAHNGNFTNTQELHQRLEKEGAIFQTTLDTELIIHLLVRAKGGSLKEKLIEALQEIEGSYSLVLILDNILVGVRDPYGFKPLCLGKLNGAYVLASETSALDLIQAQYLREVEPGEIVFISPKGLESIKPFQKVESALCIFEYIYFARPDSNIFGENVYLIRKRLGAHLSQEAPAEVDLVMPIPDSGNAAALGFAEETKLPYELGMIRNHYIGRTFIQPSQLVRDFRVKVKLNPIKQVLQGKRIVIIEDSIVRGTTSRIRVKTLREAGAREVHMRVSCPPLKFPCFYGIDFPTQEELIASQHSIEEIRDFMGLDSLEYLSQEGMLGAMPFPKNAFCTACFDGRYPVKPPAKAAKNVLE
jgi:amidophosphoribosyltransferase